jgi:hypothetical protein
MTNHPITPPLELVQQWSASSPVQHSYESWAYELFIAHQAAQWGADQELEACCDHMRDHQWGFIDLRDGTHGMHRAAYLKQARRPKPPSLKEQALAELAATERCHPADYSTIRRALEALPND